MKHLREIRRVLRRDGLAYLAVPNRWALVEPHYRLALLPDGVMHYISRRNAPQYRSVFVIQTPFSTKSAVYDGGFCELSSRAPSPTTIAPMKPSPTNLH